MHWQHTAHMAHPHLWRNHPHEAQTLSIPRKGKEKETQAESLSTIPGPSVLSSLGFKKTNTNKTKRTQHLMLLATVVCPVAQVIEVCATGLKIQPPLLMHES
ncbi:hypothetical protein KIL84_006895 [Mauremys mutica]|uniref:Uncharacterized protein n=1 Tax=Mauremys mutica TaxID=74926 RepID=A0A9D3X096_9SAUR|nr:hypothetical protein KIL84_006895 [Mauremys mutica]